MQLGNPHVLTPEVNRGIFIARIAPAFFSHAAHLKRPELHIVGGQPGSGKSTLIKQIAGDLKNRFGGNAVVTIIGDRFRAFHPHYDKFLESDAYRAGEFTDADLSRWVEQAVDLTVTQGNCVIIEGTLREPEVNIRTASLYLSHGFTVHLHVLAVHEFESRSRIFQRYFDQNRNSSYGRYTPREAHDRSYRVLPESIATLMNFSLFKSITLYDHNQNPILNINLPEKDAYREVLAALEKRRDDKHVDTDSVLLTIDHLLPMAKAKQHGKIDNDLQELRQNVLQIVQGRDVKNDTDIL